MKIENLKDMEFDHDDVCARLEKKPFIQASRPSVPGCEVTLFRCKAIPSIFMWWKKDWSWNPASEAFRITGIKACDLG